MKLLVAIVLNTIFGSLLMFLGPFFGAADFRVQTDRVEYK